VLVLIVRVSLLLLSALLFGFGAATDNAWFERHVVLPAVYPPPPSWTLPALRFLSVVMGLLLAASAVMAARLATPGLAARVAVAVALALCASELGLRVFHRVLPVPKTRVEARLGAPDPRTGWSFVPGRAVDLPLDGGGTIRYEIDAHGDRAPSAEWVEDTQADTVLITGESIAAGHGLQWRETFAARLGELLHAQVIDVAEGGYGSDQAHLRAVDALARLAHPLAVVTTVLPVQLSRNLHDDRPHLVLREGGLVLVPASGVHLRLRQLLFNDLPYLSEGGLQRSLTLMRAILRATASASRARGARPLFVVPSFGPPRTLDAHPEAFMVRALMDGLPHILVDLDLECVIAGDGHPNPEGSRRIAAAIAEALAPDADAPPGP